MAVPVPLQSSLMDETEPPIQRIRVETALSRFPIHRLAKDKREFSIDLERLTREGQVDFQWKTSFNTRYGPPGHLAYKLDTLLINRLIDEAPRPLPEILRLGSLLEISRGFEMEESGSNTVNIRRALMQSASTFIEASIKYRDRDGRETRIEIGGTRYSVILTGKEMPDGRKADAVYIVLNPWFRDLHEKVQVRPLDYNYLRLLPGSAQRLYELLSFPMYGTLLNNRPCATLLYSEFCALCPITRQTSYDRVKKQMGKIHALHHKRGYILAPVVFEPMTTVKKENKPTEPDWLMKYIPGPRARAEFDTFMRRGSATHALDAPAFASRRKSRERSLREVQEKLDFEATTPGCTIDLPTELIRRGIRQDIAIKLLANLKPEQQAMDQMEYVDSIVSQGNISNPPGLYVSYIRNNSPVPETFLTTRKKIAQEAHHNAILDSYHQDVLVTVAYEEYQREHTAQQFACLSADERAKWLEASRKEIRTRYPSLNQRQQAETLIALAHKLFRESGCVSLMSLEEFRRVRES